MAGCQGIFRAPALRAWQQKMAASLEEENVRVFINHVDKYQGENLAKVIVVSIACLCLDLSIDLWSRLQTAAIFFRVHNWTDFPEGANSPSSPPFPNPARKQFLLFSVFVAVCGWVLPGWNRGRRWNWVWRWCGWWTEPEQGWLLSNSRHREG